MPLSQITCALTLHYNIRLPNSQFIMKRESVRYFSRSHTKSKYKYDTKSPFTYPPLRCPRPFRIFVCGPLDTRFDLGALQAGGSHGPPVGGGPGGRGGIRGPSVEVSFAGETRIL